MDEPRIPCDDCKYWRAPECRHTECRQAMTRRSEQQITLPPDRQAESLGALNAHSLASIRQIILTVIDDGDPARSKFAKSLRGWHFYHDPCDGVTGFTEAMADAQRLDFCDAVEAEIVRRATPATAGRLK